jgi:hypothetical protein
MRHRGLYLVIVALLGAPALVEAATEAPSWELEQSAIQRASAAEQALSTRYTAIWATLDASQKRSFSAQERAWLNAGRTAEQQACVARAGARTEFVVRSCEAEVLERHLGALAAPQRVAVSG